jgi:acetylornithine deacetylase/succinyl-diaminopimelate desuccinylase-like protein
VLATEILQRLIQFNTVNPPGNERAALEWLAGLLTEFDVRVVGDRGNLVATIGEGEPVLGYLGHVDTVLADPDDWTVDPWSGEVRDGCVWGRGALDMKSQVAAEAAAALELARSGWRPERGTLKLVFTADEETGGEHGIQYLCSEHPELVRCDYVLNEGGGDSFEWDGRRVYEACVAEKGVFRFTVTATGRAGHASIPRIGDNALVKLAPVLSALADGRPKLELSPEPEGLLRVLGYPLDDLEADMRALEERSPELAKLIEPMLGVTMTPTMAEASHKINVIPAHAHVRVDCRVPPGLGVDHARRRVVEAIGSAEGLDVTFDEQVMGNRSPIETDLMQHIRDFVEEEDPGAAVAPTVLWGFTDSRWIRETFPDCIAYGFCPRREMDKFEAAPLIHGADERIPVSDLALATRFFVGLARKVLS